MGVMGRKVRRERRAVDKLKKQLQREIETQKEVTSSKAVSNFPQTTTHLIVLYNIPKPYTTTSEFSDSEYIFDIGNKENTWFVTISIKLIFF